MTTSATRRRAVGCAVWLLGCAAAPTRPGRGHAPTTVDTEGALEAVEGRARRCLGAAEAVAVAGFFDGRSGQFLVERVVARSAATSVRARLCVSLAMERARVRPFDGERADARWEVSTGEAAGDAGAPPTAAVGAAQASGEIDPQAVLALLRAEEPEARRCYEDALRGDPRLRGRVEVRFTLSVDGRITDALASGPPGFRAVGHCVVGHLRSLQWPAARGASVDFVFPYRFAPSP